MIAAGVAHEINNPLTYVIENLASVVDDLPRLAEAALGAAGPHDGGREGAGGATARRPGPDGHGRALLDDAASRLNDAIEGAERIKRVVAALRTFSSASSVGVGAVEVHGCVEHALRMAHDDIAERATVVRELEPVRRVLASEGQLSQVLLHLLLNAAQAISPGQPERNEIRVRAEPDGDRVRIEVSDTGCGIAPELLGRVFDPFFTTKDAGQGAGLGLSIAKNIVGSLGGEIALSSEPGAGTTVKLWLPADPARRP
jgi:signal transduction histidine kinase